MAGPTKGEKQLRKGFVLKDGIMARRQNITCYEGTDLTSDEACRWCRFFVMQGGCCYRDCRLCGDFCVCIDIGGYPVYQCMNAECEGQWAAPPRLYVGDRPAKFEVVDDDEKIIRRVDTTG